MYSVEQAKRAYLIAQAVREKAIHGSPDYWTLTGQMDVFSAIASDEQTPAEVDEALRRKEEKWGVKP
jgi:hypothetical protein